MALKYQPDKNKAKGAEDEFKEIGEAHYILSSLESNWPPYDQFGGECLKGEWAEVITAQITRPTVQGC